MQNEMIEKITEAGKSSYTAIQELGAINTKALKELTELQFGLATYSVESGVELTKAVSSTTSYKDILSAEAEYANEYGNKVMEYSRKTADVLTESRDEVVGWFEKAVENVSENVPVVAEAPKKKPAAKRASKSKKAAAATA